MAQVGSRGVEPGIRRIALLVLIGFAIAIGPRAPLAAQKTGISDKQVLAILQRCFQCHGETLQMAKLDLHTRDAMLKGGESGPAVVPGNAAASLLYKRVSGA